MHTFIKEVNGYKIKFWTMGDEFYIEEEGQWLCSSKYLFIVEGFANRQIKR